MVQINLNDKVEFYNTGSNFDGKTGIVGGFYGQHESTCLIILDVPLDDGTKVVAFPNGCLKNI